MSSNLKSFTLVLSIFLLTLIFADCKDNAVSPSSPVMDDYFPLKVGNQWTYSLSKYYNHAGQELRWTTGTDTRTILSATPGNQGTTYLFQETMDVRFIDINSQNPVTRTDTIIYSGAKYMFTVTESPNNSIAFAFLADSTGESPSSWISGVVAKLDVKRLYKASADSVRGSSVYDNLKITMDSATVAKSVGFKYIYSFSSGGGNYRWNYRDSLISYKLK